MIRGTKRPRVKSIEIIEPKAQKIDANLNVSMHNRFDIEVIDAKTGKIKQRAQAENIICNALWTRLLTPQTYFNYIHYGTGSGTPSVSDTSLFTFLGYGTPTTTDDTYSYNWDSGVVSLRRKIQLAEIVAIGATLTEVGIGYTSSYNTLCTHAMLKDMNGNQISITKTGTDIINIYATVFLHWDAFGYDSNSIKLRPCATSPYTINIYSWFLGISTAPLARLFPFFTRGGVFDAGGNSSGGAGYAFSSGNYLLNSSFNKVYSTIDKTLQLSMTRLGVAAGNLEGGLGALNILMYQDSSFHYLSTVFASLLVGGSWFPSTSISGEAIGTGDGSKRDFETGFPFITSGVKVYINGVEQLDGVVVDILKPNLYNDMGQYFQVIDEYASLYIAPTPILAGTVYNYMAEGNYAIYYNPNYQYGIKSFSKYGSIKIEVSDDLLTWADITSQNTNISAQYRTYKYWKLYSTSNGSNYLTALVADTITGKENIHFTTAPASGAVITADYTTKTIAKDENHVFDLTVTIQLGEYTE